MGFLVVHFNKQCISNALQVSVACERRSCLGISMIILEDVVEQTFKLIEENQKISTSYWLKALGSRPIWS